MIKPRVLSFTPETIQNKAAKAGAERLVTLLKNGKVLLLLSGGSAIQMYQKMFQQLETEKLDWTRLTVSLLDERYVETGSPDSNAQQLAQVGILEWLERRGAVWLPYLQNNETGPQIAERLSQEFQTLLSSQITCLLMAGIGPDGHTAGLLPTANLQVIQQVFETAKNVAFYQLPSDTDNPYRQRVTTTPAFIAQADEVLIYAPGSAKKTALQRFLAGTESQTRCPALTLRMISGSVTLLTDITAL